MINQNYLECDSCSVRVLTRTAIGHGSKQVLAFPCPGCGVGISYEMQIDQEAIHFSYEEFPDNAHWIDTNDGITYQVTFDVDYLVLKDSLIHDYEEGFTKPSPWISVAGNFKSIEHYQRVFNGQRYLIQTYFPIVERVLVHFEKSNWQLFESEISKLDNGLPIDSQLNRFEALCDVMRFSLKIYCYENFEDHGFITQRISLAASISKSELTSQIAEEYVNSGRAFEIWTQIKSIRKLLFKHFALLSPLLQTKYWNVKKIDLLDYVVCNKDFDALKLIYISTFETLARLSVIAIAIEAIIQNNELQLVTAKNRKLSIFEFEALPTANKVDHLKKYPIAKFFVPVLDTKIRNGIGHHAARYDAAIDSVIGIKVNKGEITQWEIDYTSFCDETLRLISSLFCAEKYLNELIKICSGKLTKQSLWK